MTRLWKVPYSRVVVSGEGRRGRRGAAGGDRSMHLLLLEHRVRRLLVLRHARQLTAAAKHASHDKTKEKSTQQKELFELIY